MNINDKIFVAGHKGLLGRALIDQLNLQGYINVITKSRDEVDLSNQVEVENFFDKYRPDYVINAAAKIGGIYASRTYPAEFLYENLIIQTNLLHNAWKFKVKKYLSLGTVCAYPKYAPVPVSETSLLTGPLEPSHEAYGVAKIAGIKMCEYYYKQYGFNCLSAMLCNLYGPNDNFNLDTGHVIPSMIYKFNKDKEGTVELWGDGSVRREFLYSYDAAGACLFLLNHPETGKGEIINVGSYTDISIKDLSIMVSEIVGFKGETLWDITKPNGSPKRLLDSSKINSLGWQPKHDLYSGIQATYNWFLNNQSAIRI